MSHAHSVKIGYAETIATWIVEPDYAAKFVVSNTTTYGTARFRASDLIEQSLNGRTPTAYDEDAEANAPSISRRRSPPERNNSN